MERKHILLILLICSLNVEGVRKKKHPGCAIWWFFPGCPLAKIFGPDPFNIYPWKKFCKKYSSIETSDFCDAKKEAVEEVSVQPQVEEAQSRSEEPVFRRPRNPFKRAEREVLIRKQLCQDSQSKFALAFCSPTKKARRMKSN